MANADIQSEHVLNKWGVDLIDRGLYNISWFTSLWKDVASENFTVDFAEYVGIGSYNDGCIFEIDVETELGSSPQVWRSIAYETTCKLT